MLCVSVGMAQKAADNLYNQGLKLQKTMTVKAQKQAISKFKDAKNMYDSADKKAQCDNSIAVSNNLIKEISGGGSKSKGSSSSSKSHSSSSSTAVKDSPTLDLSNTSFSVGREYKTLDVTVVTNQDSWDYSVVALSDGTSFLSADRKSNNEIQIRVPSNNTTATRTQKVMVTAGGIHKDITVTQTGIPVAIDVNEKVVKIKKKGGNKKLTVSCNSQNRYPDNYNENWYVERKPEWVVVTINEKREKGFFGKLKDKGEELMKGKSANDDLSMIESSITLTVDPLPSSNPNYATGRKGEVVLRSGDSKVTINVQQN